MNRESLKIVFFGTPEFAVESLNALIVSGFDVKAVVTAVDKPAGRGQKIKFSDVKNYALENQLPILQPTNLKSEDFQKSLRDLNADIFVVVAFRMLPESVWNMPPLGTINVHGSLLPKYRGAAPINWAIMKGEKETGVTTFRLKQEIDTGGILRQASTSIFPNENVQDLYEKLKRLGANLLIKTLDDILKGDSVEKPQNENQFSLAPKLTKDDLLIEFNRKGDNIINHIRGLSPYPGAYTFTKDKMLKIYKAHYVRSDNKYPIGKPIVISNEIRIGCRRGYIVAEEIQLEGKKRMTSAEFLNGNSIIPEQSDSK